METKQTTSVTIYVPPGTIKPDSERWINRFEIQSATSNRVYTIAQNRKSRYWACDCPGWKRYRHCKHLIAIGLPGDQRPYEVRIAGRKD